MEIEAVTAGIAWLTKRPTSHAVIVTESQNMLHKIEKNMLRREWVHLLDHAHVGRLTWIFCLGHAGVRGDETANKLARSAAVQGFLRLDKADTARVVFDKLCKEDVSEWDDNVHIRRMVEFGVRRGEGRTSALSGREQNTYN